MIWISERFSSRLTDRRFSAIYVDADDGLGGIDVQVIDQADVDCTPPSVSDVQAVVIGPSDAVVSFTTDEPAIATLRYGFACDSLTHNIHN